MDNKILEEQLPGLCNSTNPSGEYCIDDFDLKSILKHCTDKQKVKDAIKNCTHPHPYQDEPVIDPEELKHELGWIK